MASRWSVASASKAGNLFLAARLHAFMLEMEARVSKQHDSLRFHEDCQGGMLTLFTMGIQRFYISL